MRICWGKLLNPYIFDNTVYRVSNYGKISIWEFHSLVLMPIQTSVVTITQAWKTIKGNVTFANLPYQFIASPHQLIKKYHPFRRAIKQESTLMWECYLAEIKCPLPLSIVMFGFNKIELKLLDRIIFKWWETFLQF